MISSSYRYFVAISEDLSIRKAAERVHISPSALSRQVMLLEAEYGQALLTRKANGVELTAAGDILVRHIHSLLRQEHALKGDLADLGNLQFGHIRIACGNGFATSLANLILPEFYKLHPGVSYTVAVDPGDEVMRSIAEDQADIGLTFNPPAHPAIEVISSFKAPLLAVTSPQRTYKKISGGVSIDELSTTPLALPRFNHGIRRLVHQVEMAEGVRLRPAMESNSYEVLKSFIMNRNGVSLFPYFSVAQELKEGKLRAHPLANVMFQSTNGAIIVRRGRHSSLAATEFLKHLKQEIHAWENGGPT
jgi:DNA-binding transcriptional LysR family regulator